MGPSRWRAIALGLSGALALLASTAIGVQHLDYGELGFRRCRTDQTAAIGSYLQHAFPQSLPGLGGAPWEPMIDSYYHEVLAGRVRAQGLRPWEFWRTVPERPFLRVYGPTAVPPYDDPGRAWLLGLGFRLLGGAAPFLILWLGPFFACLVAGWALAEAGAAGQAPAGLVFTLLVAASPYVIETLALARSPVGFHLVALLLLLPLALAARRATPPGWAAWLLRVTLAGALFALCAVCRSGVLLLLPAFAVVLLAGCARAGGPLPRARRAAAAVACAALFLGPYVAVRPAQQHEAWAGIWEGLGDYDRSKGHAWSDRVATERVWQARGQTSRLRRVGGEALIGWLARPQAAAVLRRDVLEHVTGDPAWYAGILARRTFATLTLQRLWPFTPLDGRPLESMRSPFGGNLDKYWGYTTTADWLGLGPVQRELPVALLLAPTGALLLSALWRRWRGLPAGSGGLFCVGVLALGALALPVAVTTASGSEPQAIVLAYYLGAGLLAQAAWRRWRGPAPVEAPPAGPAERP